MHFQRAKLRNIPLLFNSAVEQIQEVSEKYGAAITVGLGDIGDKCDMETDLILQLSESLQQITLPLYLIGGNHEETKGGKSLLDLIKCGPKCTIVTDQPHVLVCGAFQVVMIPYMTNGYEDAVRQYADKDTVCLSHVLVSGAGKHLNSKYKASLFDGYRATFLGDVHDRVSFKKQNIHYTGVGIQVDYRDYGKRQGFIIHDLESNKWKRINFNLPELELNSSLDFEGESEAEQSAALKNIVESHLPTAAMLSLHEAVALLKQHLGKQKLKPEIVKQYMEKLQARLVL
jgi:DNA repair exonuclease SbcCD nuclease subunit